MSAPTRAAARGVGGTAGRTAAASGDGLDRRLVAPLMAGSVLNPVNSSMLAVTLVPIEVAFGVTPADAAWLVTGLYLATAVGQPVVGRLVDLFGPRPLYLGGTGLVGVAGVLGLLAPSLGWLVLARVLLGLGTCAAYPAAMTLLRRSEDAAGGRTPRSARVLTALSVANQVTIVLGPTLGGLLVGAGGWRAVFVVNVPLSLLCLWLGARRLPHRDELPGADAELDALPVGARARLASVDPLGMVLFAVMLLAAMLFLMEPDVRGLAWLATAVAAGVAFWHVEQRQDAPFLDLRALAASRAVQLTYVRQAAMATAAYAFLYGYSQWLEDGRGLDATTAGLLMLPMSAVGVVGSLLTGGRTRLRPTVVVGAVALVVGAAGMAVVHSTSSLTFLVLVAVVLGVPQGVVNLANQQALYQQASAERMGAAAGLLRTATYVGALVSSAVVAAVYRASADTAGVHDLAAVVAACGVVLVVTVAADRSSARRDDAIS